MCSDDGSNLVSFCLTCGCYTQVKCRGLTLPCKGAIKPKTPAWYILKRLIKGLHPITGSPVGRPARGSRPPRNSVKRLRHVSEPERPPSFESTDHEADQDSFEAWSALVAAAPSVDDDLDFDPGFDESSFFGDV